MIELLINEQTVSVVEGTSVAAALSFVKPSFSRISVKGELRSPFCGMGVCQECRVNVNGKRVLACQTLCYEGMKVEALQ